MEKVYVETHDGGYWISGSRVSLDSVVWAFLQGLSPEAIAAECFSDPSRSNRCTGRLLTTSRIGRKSIRILSKPTLILNRYAQPRER